MLCTKDMKEAELLSKNFSERGGIAWDSFPSNDPNIRLRIEAIKGKCVSPLHRPRPSRLRACSRLPL